MIKKSEYASCTKLNMDIMLTAPPPKKYNEINKQ